MRDRELVRLDAREIGRVEDMLPPWPGMCGAAEHARQPFDHRIERGDQRQTERLAAELEPLAQLGFGQREDDDAGAQRDLGEHALEMAFGTHHRPEMLDRLDAFEPRQPGLDDHVERLAGRIGQQVEVMHGHSELELAELELAEVELAEVKLAAWTELWMSMPKR